MPAKASKTIKVKVSVPKGIKNNQVMALVANSIGYDEDCGPITKNATHSITVKGNPKLLARISRDMSFIPKLGAIEYTLNLSNM